MGLDVWKARPTSAGEGRFRRGVGVAAGYWLYLWQADTEAEQIRRVLTATNGNKSRAAKILGIERKTLYRKLEKMGL